MKKQVLFAFLLIISLVALAGCGEKNAAPTPSTSPSSSPAADNEGAKEVTLKIGASSVPHAELLNLVKDQLKEEGVTLEIKEFTDYVQPNIQVDEKQLDANFFQHLAYMEQFNKDKGTKLVSAGSIHVEPFGSYSNKIKSIDELADGATVAIPSDPSNGGRALALLEKNGLIELKEGVGIAGTVKDIVANKKDLQFRELEAAMLPRVLDEVDLALINTNYALQADLVPTKDALFMEDKDSPFPNIIAAREDNKDSEAIQKLVKALQTPEVKAFIEEKYEGAIIPAF
ncbi:MetQ/NlpA family ABC transporter substrate-binding protein [Paenibacillus sp. J2TS4]|uniref:MetQ/NlpA family ABC transporter substrate-binding protein n=1 Tax=Paenibacillus sp. J2TS4 TaxID=2807194 RepID=UPI001B07924D|nr:MetQ/NlpA family ABC transporter substrate-binding protein [Paenibacillus sp. J2TS4]GIP32231.1 methionine ABC transporter substrate-binding protein [Paenibacillus sp. J2TS4]